MDFKKKLEEKLYKNAMSYTEQIREANPLPTYLPTITKILQMGVLLE